jgi:hypothetical protein
MFIWNEVCKVRSFIMGVYSTFMKHTEAGPQKMILQNLKKCILFQLHIHLKEFILYEKFLITIKSWSELKGYSLIFVSIFRLWSVNMSVEFILCYSAFSVDLWQALLFILYLNFTFSFGSNLISLITFLLMRLLLQTHSKNRNTSFAVMGANSR